MAAVVNRLCKPSAFSASSSTVASLRKYLSTATVTQNEAKSTFQTYPHSSLPPRGDPKDRNIRWVFLGPPGVDKGTYARRLSGLLGVTYINGWDLFSEEEKRIMDDRGVPPYTWRPYDVQEQKKQVLDKNIIKLLSKRLQAGKATGDSGFILDGFPQTITQAAMLNDVTDIDLVVNLKLPENVLVEKILGRRVCQECLKTFNVASINVKGENGSPSIIIDPILPPPECLSKLSTMTYHAELLVEAQLRAYNGKTQPLEELFRQQGKLLEFNLPGGVPQSWPKLLEALNLDEHCRKQTEAVGCSINCYS